jgi:hypothetical protein
MKEIYDLIRQKEGDLERIQREIDALRLSAKLLEDSGRPAASSGAAAPTTTYNAPSKTQVPGQATAAPSAWASAKQFP